MRRLQRLLFLVGLGVALAAPGFAQSYTLNSTTLSAAMTDSATTASLTSASAATGSTFGAVTAGQAIYVDHELMRITAVSGTTITVSRTGSQPAAHADGATVYIGTPSAFKLTDPPVGTCDSTAVPSPWINAQAGRVWTCVNSTWALQGGAPLQGTVYAVLNAAIASAATIAPNLGVTHVTGTTTINTITVPDGCGGACSIVLIPDGLWSTGTSGNIAIATTGVVSKALILFWDGTKWRPSY